MLREIKDILSIPLKIWFMLIALPSLIIYVMVMTQTLTYGLIILLVVLYPMYRIMKRREDTQALDMDNKSFPTEERRTEIIEEMLEQKGERS